MESQLESSSSAYPTTTNVGRPTSPDGLVLEAWAQGYMVGSLIIMSAITIANMRKKVLLHKLILLELVLGIFHGTFIFNHPPVYGWYLSTTAIFLNISWSLHNLISWMKTKPFLSRKWSLFYIATLIIAQPYWVVEIYANFTYFNNINTLFLHTRPFEAIFRDPWWIFSILNLYWNLMHSYKLSIPAIVRISPRFGVLLVALFLSFAFTIVDICAVTGALMVDPDGLNPFWKLAYVFKCLTDSIILDDFKTALDRLMRYKMRRERFGSHGDEPLGATAGTAEEIAEEEARMKGEQELWGQDAAERGNSVATAEGRGSEGPRGGAQEGASPTSPRSGSKRFDPWDDVYLPDFKNGSASDSSGNTL